MATHSKPVHFETSSTVVRSEISSRNEPVGWERLNDDDQEHKQVIITTSPDCSGSQAG
jgi:hypothetical protein